MVDLSAWLLVELDEPGSVDCVEDEDDDGVDEVLGYVVEGDVVELESVLDGDLLCVLEVCA